MSSEHNIKLSANEISQIWSAYMNSSLSYCLFTYFLDIVEDQGIKAVVEYGYHSSKSHVDKLTEIFKREGFPVPYGFKVEEDVNLQAPKLFSDTFILHFVYSMGEMALSFYALAKTLSVRSDIQAYFSKCLKELDQFDTKAKEVLLSKGLFVRSPNLNPAEAVNFIKNDDFMAGWFGRRNSLTAIEITNIFANLRKNALGRAAMIGFSQVAQNEEVEQFMLKGKEIAGKHLKVFGKILEGCDLPIPMSSDIGVTSAINPPFSDKLMMFMTTALIALSIGAYATSMATSMRKDISLQYIRLSAEIGLYAEEGAKIMIENGWLEQPPLSDDRERLANN